jgi:hypothetical protein
LVTRGETRGVVERLVAEIDRARERCDRYVIVESGPYFVQFMPNHRANYGEVVSNHYLRGDERLDPAQELRLFGLGWVAPNVRCHPDCPNDFHPNFTKVWASSVPSGQIAREMLHGLVVAISAGGEGAAVPVVKGGARLTRPTAGAVPGH